MTDLNSITDYISREKRARELAESAKTPEIAAIHLEMAARYAGLIAAPTKNLFSPKNNAQVNQSSQRP
ncbi:hypothetical protein WG907_11085 [Sphingobium sp. AN558]|uniref:hypothetical protein n=1 Tax=Sphingobium sp. AN558 TaxID=3133442 RepID=UPI0030BA87C8